MKNLKEKLLSLDVFLDNEYLDFYCTLIENNKNTKKEKFKTERHHFIPVDYYKIKNNLKTRKEALSIADRDVNNFKVNLYYKDHVLAHYYLYFCINDEYLKNSNRSCFILMCGRVDNIDLFNDEELNKLQLIHEEYRQRDSQRMKNNKINLGRVLNDENKLKRSIKQKELTQNGLWKNPMSSPESIEKMRNSLKQKYANGTFKGRRGSKHSKASKKLMSEHCIMHQQKYRDNLSKKLKGRIPWNKGKKGVQKSSIKNKKAIHKDNINKYVSIDELDSYLSCGWVLGGKSFKIKT